VDRFTLARSEHNKSLKSTMSTQCDFRTYDSNILSCLMAKSVVCTKENVTLSLIGLTVRRDLVGTKTLMNLKPNVTKRTRYHVKKLILHKLSGKSIHSVNIVFSLSARAVYIKRGVEPLFVSVGHYHTSS
jgi:hypothetical protein